MAYTGDSYTDKFAFFEAIRSGDKALLLSYLDQGYTLGQKNDSGNTELGYSLVAKQEDIALLLLKRGSRPDEFCSGLKTPFMLAVQFGLEEAALAMVERGVNLDHKDKYGATPMGLIRDNNVPRVYQAVWRKMDEMKRNLELHTIIQRGKIDTLKKIVEEDGLDILAREESLEPFIELAAKDGHTAIPDYINEKRAVRTQQEFEAQREVVLRVAAESTVSTIKRMPAISFRKR